MALNPGDTAIVTTATDPSINFRGDPSTNNDPIGTLVRGLAVLITGAPVGAFFPVRTPDGQNGWAGAAYLVAAPAPFATPAPAAPSVTITPTVVVDPNLGLPAPAAPSSKLPLIIGGVLLLGILGVAMTGSTSASVRRTARR